MSALSEEIKCNESATTCEISAEDTTDRLVCYMANKSLKLSKYELDITSPNLKIISASKKLVKVSIPLQTIHIQTRTRTTADKSKLREPADLSTQDSEESK